MNGIKKLLLQLRCIFEFPKSYNWLLTGNISGWILSKSTISERLSLPSCKSRAESNEWIEWIISWKWNMNINELSKMHWWMYRTASTMSAMWYQHVISISTVKFRGAYAIFSSRTNPCYHHRDGKDGKDPKDRKGSLIHNSWLYLFLRFFHMGRAVRFRN